MLNSIPGGKNFVVGNFLQDIYKGSIPISKLTYDPLLWA